MRILLQVHWACGTSSPLPNSPTATPHILRLLSFSHAHNCKLHPASPSRHERRASQAQQWRVWTLFWCHFETHFDQLNGFRVKWSDSADYVPKYPYFGINAIISDQGRLSPSEHDDERSLAHLREQAKCHNAATSSHGFGVDQLVAKRAVFDNLLSYSKRYYISLSHVHEADDIAITRNGSPGFRSAAGRTSSRAG